MQFTLALAALAAVAFASPAPQVTTDIAPTGSPPAGFKSSYSGTFQITAVNISSLAKREVSKRAACGTSGSLTISLANGVLTDGEKRTGYIASNYQFQFDDPAQTGAIYTSGWSVGANNSLALGPSAVFYQCLSGDFYNLYDRSWAPQCVPIVIEILPCASAATTANAITQLPDGQPQAPTSTPVSVPCAVTQIKDGQIQVTACASTSAITSAITSAATKAPITQISDGQIQAPTSAPTTSATKIPISQISDGQIQAPTAVPNATASSTPVPFTGAASGMTLQAQFAAAVVGLAAVFLL